MHSLEESLERVQRQLRNLRLFTALLGVALVLSVVVPPRELRASRFVLVDQSGQQRGVFRVSDGVPALMLQDAAGSWRAMLSVDGDLSWLNLTRSTGESGLSLNAGKGTSSITVYGDGGKPEMELSTTPDGPRVTMPGR
jgi:hypothetical protein